MTGDERAASFCCITSYICVCVCGRDVGGREGGSDQKGEIRL